MCNNARLLSKTVQYEQKILFINLHNLGSVLNLFFRQFLFMWIKIIRKIYNAYIIQKGKLFYINCKK